MHMKNPFLFGLMAILLLGGTITPGLSQTAPSGSEIIINEVEFNPRGSDAGLGVGGTGNQSKSIEGISGAQEYVEIYNPTLQEIDISGWSLVPTATWKTYEIPPNTIIGPESFLVFTHVNFWFKDFGESVSLYDDAGDLIDETPLLKDQDDESTTWQRSVDGLDTNTINDWELKRMTPKSSNGIEVETKDSSFTLIAETDKSNYVFGDTLTISGNVSEKLYIEKPYFSPEMIKITVTGPNYYKNIALFPNTNLEFSTMLTIQEVLGFSTGNYNVKLNYGTHSLENNFSIDGDIQSSTNTSEIVETLDLFTDQESYLPGDTVVLFADTTSSLEFGGLEYSVTNPNGDTIFEGTIFPNSEFSIVNQQGGGQLYPFSTQLYLSTVNPIFGEYEINGVFKSQNAFSTNSNSLSGKTTFVLAEDIKEDVMISLSTDKEVYSVDDVIKVSGRSNEIWTEDISLKVDQASMFIHLDNNSAASKVNPFSLNESLRLDGDGRFSFEFKLVDNFSETEDYSYAYGDYKIAVSEYFGDASVIIKVVENPSTFEDIRTPLNLKTDQNEYVLGTPMKISGSITNYDHKPSNNMRNYVEIKISDSSGKVLSYFDHQQKTGYTNCNTNDCEKYSKPLIYTAIPDSIGNFELDLVIYPNQFVYDQYTISANHPESKTNESVNFSVISAQGEILSENETGDPISMQICKSTRGEISEIIKDLKVLGKGELGASMESVDCSDFNSFEIGEKLVVIGKVIPKTGINLDQSSTNPSGSTQFGSSYSTNFSQAIMNYVQVSIPYPTSMSIIKSSNYQTVPDEGVVYKGGGGSGGGGSYYEDADGNIIRGDRGDKTTEDRQTGYDGQAILKKQKLLLTDMNFKAYPDEDGNFHGVFDLRAGIFGSGTYLVKANYFGHQTQQLATVVDNSMKGGQSPEVILTFDKSEYIPGETVRINGKITNAFYYDMVSLNVNSPDASEINCFSGQQCGLNAEKKIRIQDGIEGPTFFMNYKIPKSGTLGEYTVTADTHFGIDTKSFFVIPESDVIGEIPPNDSTPSVTKIIEKFNRIADNEIPINLTEKSSDDSTLVPRVIQGSLFTSARGAESDVNLTVTTTDGQCVIGQSSGCLVSESTRKPGAIYSIVTIDDINYKIRYSGNDVRLEKFSIVPENSGTKIDINNWNVEIIKDEQPTRFYYKVSYVALE